MGSIQIVEGIVDTSGVGVAERKVCGITTEVAVNGITGIGESGMPGFRSHALNNNNGIMNKSKDLLRISILNLARWMNVKDIFVG